MFWENLPSGIQDDYMRKTAKYRCIMLKQNKKRICTSAAHREQITEV